MKKVKKTDEESFEHEYWTCPICKKEVHVLEMNFNEGGVECCDKCKKKMKKVK